MAVKPAPNNRPITPRQQEALDFIRGHIADTGSSPTRDEIGAHLSITRVAAQGLVVGLAAKGIVAIEQYETRGIRVL